MQRMFAEDTPWKVNWMERITDQVIEMASRHAEQTVFTRFIAPQNPDQLPGRWRDYYRKWSMMTLDHLHPELVDVLPPLTRFSPPARVFDKHTYSPWIDGRLHAALTADRIATLVISGGETDVCVLATVLGGIDLGYRVLLLEDAVCGGADETHDASLKLVGDRFSVQVDYEHRRLSLAGRRWNLDATSQFRSTETGIHECRLSARK